LNYHFPLSTEHAHFPYPIPVHECDQSGLSDEIPVDDNNAIKSYQEFDQLNTLESNNGHQHSSTTDATVGGDFVNQETESLAIENGKQLELEPEFLRHQNGIIRFITGFR
jgi:hypothetical protein